MFPEEKAGVQEVIGEVRGGEEEDTSDAPTIVMPVRQYNKEEKDIAEDWFFPF